MSTDAKISLRAARINRSLSQKEAADKLRIGSSTLQGYESGKRHPRLDTLRRMERLYGINIQQFRLGLSDE